MCKDAYVTTIMPKDLFSAMAAEQGRPEKNYIRDRALRYCSLRSQGCQAVFMTHTQKTDHRRRLQCQPGRQRDNIERLLNGRFNARLHAYAMAGDEEMQRHAQEALRAANLQQEAAQVHQWNLVHQAIFEPDTRDEDETN